MLKKVAARHGKERRTWIMDRGIPTEDTLEEMRRAKPSVSYLVGTPKGRLTKLEKDLAAKEWQEVKDDVHVKLLPRGGELYVLARSQPRRGKESAMRRKKLKAYWSRLKELQQRAKLTRDELLLAYRTFAGSDGLPPYDQAVVERLRMKPVRTSSGVTQITNSAEAMVSTADQALPNRFSRIHFSAPVWFEGAGCCGSIVSRT